MLETVQLDSISQKTFCREKNEFALAKTKKIGILILKNVSRSMTIKASR